MTKEKMHHDRIPGEKVLEYIDQNFGDRPKCFSKVSGNSISFTHVRDHCICDIEQSFLAGHSTALKTADRLIDWIDDELQFSESSVTSLKIRRKIASWKGED
jgi:hypothetical protein